MKTLLVQTMVIFFRWKWAVFCSLFLFGMKCLGLTYYPDLEMTFVSNPLEMHRDSIAIDLNIRIPSKYMHKTMTVEVTPVLGDNEFRTLSICGEKANGNCMMLVSKEGKTIHYNDKIPYDVSMRLEKLKVKILAKKGKKTREELIELGIGTIITPQWATDPLFMSMKGEKTYVYGQKVSSIDVFHEKSDTIISDEVWKSVRVKEILKWILGEEKDAANRLYKIEIGCYESPEGEVAKNRLLTDSRAADMKLKIEQLLDEMEIKGIEIEAKGKGEDWAGFQLEMKKQNIEEKQLTLRGDYKTEEERLAAKRELDELYALLEKEVFPQLRRTTVSFYYEDGLVEEEYLYQNQIEAIKKGDYDHAIQLAQNDYLTALALTLKREYGRALQILDNGFEKDRSYAFYLRAIIAIREENVTLGNGFSFLTLVIVSKCELWIEF